MSSLNIWWDLPIDPSRVYCASCLGNLLISDSISLIDIGLSISSCLGFDRHFFKRIGPFHLGYQLCGHTVIHNIPSFSGSNPGWIQGFPQDDGVGD